MTTIDSEGKAVKRVLQPPTGTVESNQAHEFGARPAAGVDITFHATTATSDFHFDASADQLLGPVYMPTTTVTLDAAGAVTLTAAEVLGGIWYNTDGTAGNPTLPTAALLVAAVPNARVGTTIKLAMINVDANEAVTVTAGTGGTLVGNGAIAALTGRQCLIRFTNVTSSSEAYQIFLA